MVKFCSIILLVTYLQVGSGQHVDDIAYYADVVANAAEGQHRVRANDLLVEALELYLQPSDADLTTLANQAKYISQKPLENSDYVLYSWQVKISEDIYESHGYLKNAGGTLIKLADNAALSGDLVYEELTADRWLGVVYYKTLPIMLDGNPAWLLFGYDGHSKFDRIKVCDVLRIVEGQPVFGAEIFKRGDGKRPDVRYRLLLSYSSDSNVTLNYNPSMDIIIHDHLINRVGRMAGQGETWLPDGSYEGYVWDGTYWTYDEKVFEQVLQDGEFPRPSPVLDIRKEGRGK